MQETLEAVEVATEQAFVCEHLHESLRTIVAIGNRLNLHSLLPHGTEPNALQLARFRKRAAHAFELRTLERVLGTRLFLDEAAKLSHFLVALCAPAPDPPVVHMHGRWLTMPPYTESQHQECRCSALASRAVREVRA
jgi:hypothetical protein